VDGVPDNPYPAKIINMSLGGGTCTQTYRDVVAELQALGVVIVASGGNSAGDPLEAPASCPGVVGVVALRNVGTKVGFSSLGSATTPAVLAAPGGNCVNTSGACLYPILIATNSGSTAPAVSTWTNSFNYSLGTSFSAPLAAGALALVRSVQPDATAAQSVAFLTGHVRAFPTSGGTAGISQCRTPVANVVQDECYCTTTTCGAGMLDAGAALAAAVPATLLNISYGPVAPAAGESVDFRITGLQLRSGRTVLSYSWVLVTGGGAAAGFSSASNASTAAMATTGSGTATVRLTVTDNTGETVTATQVVKVLAAATTGGGSTGGSSGGGSGGGGGAASGAWVAGVGLAAAVLLWLQVLQARALRLRALPRRL
jgi:serine protease